MVTKTHAKKTKVAAATESTFAQEFLSNLHDGMHQFLVYEAPSPRRQIAAVVLSFTAICASWYAAAPFIAASLIVVSTLTGFQFLGFLAACLTMLLVWYAAAKIGAFVYDVVSAQVLERGVRRAWAPCAARIAEWKSDRTFFAAAKGGAR